jgi:beta-glucosidase
LALETLEQRCLLSSDNPAVIPEPSNNDFWIQRFNQLQAAPKGNPDVIFLGDSIMDGYQHGAGITVWNAQVAPLNAADFAIGASATQNVLYEINQGQLDDTSPRVVVLMIGTNNLGLFGETPDQTAGGVQACVDDILAKQPQTQVLLLGVLPRGESPTDPYRDQITELNRLIAPLGRATHVRYLDIGGWFLQPDGTISSADMDDYLHPTAWGYQMMSAAINPLLRQMLGAPPPALPFVTFAVGSSNGRVEVFERDNTLVGDFAPFGAAYGGPVSVAVGDVNGDGYNDLVVGAAKGNPDVRVYDGRAFARGTFDPAQPNASLLAQFFPYALQFNVGANVAVGDVTGDGFADIVTGATAGNPDVRVYSGKDIARHSFSPNGASLVAQFFPYALQFDVGANVAVGDVNHDGYGDIVTGPTAGNPDVRVYSGKDIARGAFDPAGASQLAQWFAFAIDFDVGVNVAVGDTEGDGDGDVITGATSGNPDVRIYSGKDIALGNFDPNHPEAGQLDQFFAFSLGSDGGVTVGAADFEHHGRADILTGSTKGPSYRVVAGNAQGVAPPPVIQGNPPDLQGGLSVGA